MPVGRKRPAPAAWCAGAAVRYPTRTLLSCSSMEYHYVRMISGLNRRQVLRGAAASGAGVLLSTGLLGKVEAAGERLAVEEYDVVVVGCGAAGMTAALRAAHRGLRVVVV